MPRDYSTCTILMGFDSNYSILCLDHISLWEGDQMQPKKDESCSSTGGLYVLTNGNKWQRSLSIFVWRENKKNLDKDRVFCFTSVFSFLSHFLFYFGWAFLFCFLLLLLLFCFCWAWGLNYPILLSLIPSPSFGGGGGGWVESLSGWWCYFMFLISSKLRD